MLAASRRGLSESACYDALAEAIRTKTRLPYQTRSPEGIHPAEPFAVAFKAIGLDLLTVAGKAAGEEITDSTEFDIRMAIYGLQKQEIENFHRQEHLPTEERDAYLALAVNIGVSLRLLLQCLAVDARWKLRVRFCYNRKCLSLFLERSIRKQQFCSDKCRVQGARLRIGGRKKKVHA